MKKTLLLIMLGLGSLCLSSCSRGYGCPYTMETKIKNTRPSTIENATPKSNAVEGIACATDEVATTITK